MFIQKVCVKILVKISLKKTGHKTWPVKRPAVATGYSQLHYLAADRRRRPMNQAQHQHSGR